MNRRILALLGVFSLVLVLGALPLSGATPIKIGALFDYTGPCASLGPKFEAGLRLALEEAGYKVAGRDIQLIIEDSATSVSVALEKFKKLVDSDGISICIGPLMGDAHLAIAPYAIEKKVIVTSIVNGMRAVASMPGSTYIEYPTTCEAQTYFFGQYVYNNLGYRTMVTIGANYAGKIAYANGAAEGFKASGGTVIGQLWPPVGCQDYSPYISGLAATVADVILYALEGPGPVSRFVYQAREMGVTKPMVTITQDGDYDPESLAELGAASLGIQGEASYTWQLDNPENKAFVAAIMAKTHVVPSCAEQNTYTMGKLMLAALEKTAGNDTFGVLWPTILGLKLRTPAGPLSFTPEGCAITDGYVTQAEFVNGVYQLSAPLYTYPNIIDPQLPSQKK
jgi:branched-chain amino acid transport system substrate-binding protein